MARAYAQGTEVPIDRSKAEIERTLSRYGADQFLSGWDRTDGRAFIAFRAHQRHIRFTLDLPDRAQFETTPTGKRRTESASESAWEQACRERWRSLALVIKAKLEAVRAGIVVFDEEFMAHIVLPDGQSVGQWLAPQIERAYQDGRPPALLPDYSRQS